MLRRFLVDEMETDELDSIFALVVDVGGGPTGYYFGAKTWNNPGAFAAGFKGVCSVFVTAAFSFGGTELVGLAAAEAANPRLSLPTAIKQVFWRVVLVSCLSEQKES
jgi:amino acid transporter